MILGIQYLTQLPVNARYKICVCGDNFVYGTRPLPSWKTFRCRECSKPPLVYLYKCVGCADYFVKTPSFNREHMHPESFAHPGWNWNNTKCWYCLEKDPDFVCLNSPDAILRHSLAVGKIPPKKIKEVYTEEELEEALNDLLGL